MASLNGIVAARRALLAARDRGCDPSEPWPEARPFEDERPTERPYPVELLPKVVRDATFEIAGDAQVPVAMAAVAVLVASATAVQHLADVRVAQRLRYPANLAALAVARSGDRKSTVDHLATAALRDWPRSEAATREREEASRAKAARRARELEIAGLEAALKAASAGRKPKGGASREELRAKLETLRLTPLPLAIEPELLIEDCSPEALRVHLARCRPSAGLFVSEAGLLLGGAATRGERALGFLATINQVYDGRLGLQVRITREAIPPFNCRLSLSLAIQPKVITGWLHGDGALARGIGLLGRFLFVAEPSLTGSRLFKPQSDGRAMRRLAELHCRRLGVPVRFREGAGNVLDIIDEEARLSPRAFAVWRDHHDEVERLQAPGAELFGQSEIAGRSAEQAARVALVLHLLEAGPDRDITERAMLAGIAVARWHLYAMVEWFTADRDRAVAEDAEILLAWLQRQKSAPSMHELARHVPYRLRLRKRREQAIVELEARGLARRETHPDGSTRLVLRPDRLTKGPANFSSAQHPATSATPATSVPATLEKSSSDKDLRAATEAAARLRPPAASAASDEHPPTGPNGADPASPALLDRAVELAIRGDLALLRSELLATLGRAREAAIAEVVRRTATMTDREAIRAELAALFDKGGTP